MGTNGSVRQEVTMLGLGGGGVLTAGRLLGAAGINQFNHTLWYPSYFTQSRGGPCECTVVFSGEEIYSPLLDHVQVMIVLHPTQFKTAEARVQSGGLVIAEQMGLSDKLERTDVRLIEVPAAQAALDRFDSIKGSNIVLLGAYVAIVKSVSPQAVERAIETRFASQQAALKVNLDAFRTGLELGAELEVAPALA